MHIIILEPNTIEIQTHIFRKIIDNWHYFIRFIFVCKVDYGNDTFNCMFTTIHTHTHIDTLWTTLIYCKTMQFNDVAC